MLWLVLQSTDLGNLARGLTRYELPWSKRFSSILPLHLPGGRICIGSCSISSCLPCLFSKHKKAFSLSCGHRFTMRYPCSLTKCLVSCNWLADLSLSLCHLRNEAITAAFVFLTYQRFLGWMLLWHSLIKALPQSRTPTRLKLYAARYYPGSRPHALINPWLKWPREHHILMRI